MEEGKDKFDEGFYILGIGVIMSLIFMRWIYYLANSQAQ